jgi:hypothetical protein
MLTLHLISLAFVFVVIVCADTQAFSWMSGRKETLDAERLHVYHGLMWLGLALMIGTGLMLFWPAREYLIGNPVFLAKMAFVVVLIGNGFIIGNLMEIAKTRPYKSLTSREKIPIFLSGAVSTIAWISAAGIAFFFG